MDSLAADDDDSDADDEEAAADDASDDEDEVELPAPMEVEVPPAAALGALAAETPFAADA